MRSWFCAGCNRRYPLSRDIEGLLDGGEWRRASIERAAKQGRNHHPPSEREWQDIKKRRLMKWHSS